MPLTRSDKETVVAEVNGVASTALSLVGADYRGLPAEELRDLRKQAHEAGVYMRVVKNTLTRVAVEGTDFECVRDALTGPMLLAFSEEDPGAAARVIKKFAKSNDKLEVTLVSTGGQLLTPGDLGRLADLPTREQALGMLAGVLQAPVAKFVRTLAEPTAKMVRTVAAVRDQKEAA